MKKFTLGFLLGALMFGFISVAATATHNIMPNPFRILVDGEERVVEASLINDRTFLQLRGVGYLFDGVEVDFVDGVIIIETENKEERDISIEQDRWNTSTDNQVCIDEYILLTELDRQLLAKHRFVFENSHVSLFKQDENGALTVLKVDNIPFEVILDRIHIPLSFVESHLQPFLER